MAFLKNIHGPTADPFGHVWDDVKHIVEVTEDQARELLGLPTAGFVAVLPGDPEHPDVEKIAEEAKAEAEKLKADAVAAAEAEVKKQEEAIAAAESKAKPAPPIPVTPAAPVPPAAPSAAAVIAE